jgi:hypothetical protein
LKHFITLIIIAFLGQSSFSQVSENERDVDTKGIVYNTEWSGFAQIAANGYGLGYQTGKIETYYKTSFYQIELNRIFDQREQRHNKNIALRFNRLSNSFKYGKLNDVFVMRLLRGQMRYLSDRAIRKGVAVAYSYAGGGSIGLVKPYHLNLIYPNNTDGTTRFDIKSEAYSEENKIRFVNYDEIYGGARWTDGLAQTSILPGLHGRASLLFSIGRYDKTVKNIETGIMLDLFVRKIPLMIENELVKNRPYSMNLFIKASFGKRKF